MHSNHLWSFSSQGRVCLEQMLKLLERLRLAGIPINPLISEVMESVNPSIFTDFSIEPFWNDLPVPFLRTKLGALKTFSAPHMIVTLLHHLEVRHGQKILLIGSKSGYFGALLDSMVGHEGMITIIEPHDEVKSFTEKKIQNYESMGMINIFSDVHEMIKKSGIIKFDRTIISGSISRIPVEVEDLIIDGGFLLAPIGGPIQQRLMKRERQSKKWFDTDLGGVVFGPMDASLSERSDLDPEYVADHIEDIFRLLDELIEMDSNTMENMRGLVTMLRELPDDIPDLDELSTDEEIMDHPVISILMSQIDWLGPMWSIINDYLSLGISNPGGYDGDEQEFLGGHEDLIP